MVKELLLSLVLVGSVASTPTFANTQTETDYYRVTGSYDTNDFHYSGIYTTNSTRRFDNILIDIAENTAEYFTYQVFGQNITCNIIAYDGDSLNFDLDTFYWCIASTYEENDRFDNETVLLLNPKWLETYPISNLGFKFNFCCYSISSNNNYNYVVSQNNLWSNFQPNNWLTTYRGVTRSCFIQDTFEIMGYGSLDTDLGYQDYSTCVGCIQYDLYYGLRGAEFYDNVYDNGYEDGYLAGYQNGYRNGDADGRLAGTNFYTLLGRIADTPIIVLRSMFNVHIFGVNVYLVVTSLITLLIVIWIIKKVFIN